MSTKPDIRQQRPLSPHLQVYKPQITSAMSILHRLTGVALVAGTLPLVLWLWGAAFDPDLLKCVSEFFGHWLGQLMLIGWTVAFYYHLANGIRHLIWDTGRGITMAEVNKSGVIAIVFVLVATFATCIAIYQGA